MLTWPLVATVAKPCPHAIDDHIVDGEVGAAVGANTSFGTRKLDIVLDRVLPPRVTVLLVLRTIDHHLRREQIACNGAVGQRCVGDFSCR